MARRAGSPGPAAHQPALVPPGNSSPNGSHPAEPAAAKARTPAEARAAAKARTPAEPRAAAKARTPAKARAAHKGRAPAKARTPAAGLPVAVWPRAHCAHPVPATADAECLGAAFEDSIRCGLADRGVSELPLVVQQLRLPAQPSS